MKAAIYCRVSTTDQSTELQRNEITRYIESRGWDLHQVYDDVGKTGTNANRPEFKNLMNDARERKFDVLVIWKLDRLFRSLKGMVNSLTEFEELGIEFVSMKDHIDLTTINGRLMAGVLGAFAEFEADLIRERVKAGLENAKKKGVKLGRPRKINNQDVLKLYRQGLSLGKIAEQLNISKSGVHGVVKTYLNKF